MTSEIVPYAGWQRNLRIANDDTELIVTLDVGPRILSYRTGDGANVFKTFEEELGGSGEDRWLSRGGHRLWTAPEDEIATYHQDNFPVSHHEESGGWSFVSNQSEPISIRKELNVRLESTGSAVSVGHLVTNEGSRPLRLATWGLSVMDAGGMAIIPQPPLGEHPRDLLPNRGIVVWPYSDLTDIRFTLGRRFILLQQTEEGTPFKIGLIHRENWVAYLVGETLFLKTIELLPATEYPDGGCNFEMFTNKDMLELESLGPLQLVEPGASVGHTEHWRLFSGIEAAEITSEDALMEWIKPYIDQVIR